MTLSDTAWTMLFAVLFLPITVGAMIVAGGYLTPIILGTPNSCPRHGFDAFLEFALLFGGMGIGMLVAFIIFCFITRRFLDAETRERWELQFERGAADMSPLHRALTRLIMKRM